MIIQRKLADLQNLSLSISSDSWHKAENWQGADVVITRVPISVDPNSFYPGPRSVVTDYAPELSWLFEQLRDLVNNLEGYGFWKEEFFGRLGNAANRFISRESNLTCKRLLLAVIHECFCILEEMQIGEFTALPITFNNEIYDDIFRQIENEGSADADEVEEFIKSLGVTP
jgi:hypothetical protein